MLLFTQWPMQPGCAAKLELQPSVQLEHMLKEKCIIGFKDELTFPALGHKDGPLS